MLVIGLTGSIAMGKSEVANYLRKRGYPVFDSDREVHALYDSEDGVNLLRYHVPDAIIDGRVDRAMLSRAVLDDNAKLEKLESLVHQEIARRRNDFLSEMKTEGHQLAFVDVPLLFETGANEQVDVTLVVSSPEDMQVKRALARQGMTEDKLNKIISRQWPDSDKRKRADFVIENQGSLSDLHAAVDDVLKKITAKVS